MMLDFVGMEDVDAATQKGMLDFSYFLTIGNMDEVSTRAGARVRVGARARARVSVTCAHDGCLGLAAGAKRGKLVDELLTRTRTLALALALTLILTLTVTPSPNP